MRTPKRPSGRRSEKSAGFPPALNSEKSQEKTSSLSGASASSRAKTTSFETADSEFTHENAARVDSARRTQSDVGVSTALAVITAIFEIPHTPVLPSPPRRIEKFRTALASGIRITCSSKRSLTATGSRVPRKEPPSPEIICKDLVGDVDEHLTEKIIPTIGLSKSAETRASSKLLNLRQSDEYLSRPQSRHPSTIAS